MFQILGVVSVFMAGVIAGLKSDDISKKVKDKEEKSSKQD